MDNEHFNPQASLLPWHITPWQKLTRTYPKLGHAFLLCGKQGAGKREFASHFAKWLLCSDKQPMGACGQCRNCLWVQAGTHPQIKQIIPDFDDKKQIFTAIKIDQIRGMSDFVQQTVEGWRIIFIYPAEQLNIASSNALLKTLEEPGDRVILLLISDSPLKLSATIRSRVQKIHLDRIELQQAQAYLNHRSQDADQAIDHLALNLAEYMPLKAQQMLESQWFKKRSDFYKAWVDLVKYKNQPIKFANSWLKELEFKEILIIVRYILQDCIAYKLDQAIKQTDLEISLLCEYYSLEQFFSIYEHLNKTTTMLNQNVQTQLIFDELAMRLMNIDAV